MDSIDVSERALSFVAENVENSVSDFRDIYMAARRAGDREHQRQMIKALYDLPWKPTIGFIADVCDEPRARILATIQDQNWSR
jgi:hypothetical protein